MAIRPSPLEGVVVNPNFWQGKRVFLTGHTGFKGGWLSLWLQQLGAVVTGYALQPPTTPNLFEKAHVGACMTSIIGDIRDGPRLQAALGDASPDIVIHMAAQPLVRRSYVDPVETYSTNVMGTVHLLEAVRHCASVRAVVNVTTDKCYENREWLWPYRENEALGGYDPYSSSKACAELVTAAYRNSYFSAKDRAHHRLGLATARAGNVIGGGDWAENRLVPDILRAFSSGEPVMIRNPHAVRPWQHVLEPLRGYLTLAERLFTDGASYAEAFNFGPREADAQPVEWIVRQLAAKWGDAALWSLDGGNHPHEASLLRLDVSKAAHRLAWRPILDLDSALHLTVDWALAARDDQDMRAFTLFQINDYQIRTAAT
jgi:CDP-glucose 4,6-dehydratase